MKTIILSVATLISYAAISQTVLEPNPSNYVVTAPCGLTTLNNKLIYVGSTVANGRELWSTDGNQESNQIIKEIGYFFSSPVTSAFLFNTGPETFGYFGKLNNKLYFQASTGTAQQLPTGFYTSDGTEAGTVQIGADYFIRNIRFFQEFNGRLYFTAYSNANGREIWSTDGTLAGTTMLKDINPGAPAAFVESYDPHFTIFNGRLFFVANDGTHGYELWSTDGTNAGTSMFVDLRNPEPSDNTVLGAFYSSGYSYLPLKVFNGRMYFSANAGVAGDDSTFSLYSTDGTASGTSRYNIPSPQNCQCAGDDVPNSLLAISGMTVIGDKMYLFAASRQLILTQSGVWQIDGNGGATLLKFFSGNIGNIASGDEPAWTDMREFNGEYYFLGSNSSFGSSAALELWKMSADLAFTKIVGLNANQTSDFANSQGFVSTVFGNKLYFVKTAQSSAGIFSTDGSVSGTVAASRSVQSMTKNRYNSTSSVQAMTVIPTELKVLDNSVYFQAGFDGQPAQLFRIRDQNLDTEAFDAITKIKVYPNPSTGFFNVKLPTQVENCVINVANLSGQIIYKNTIFGEDISINLTDAAAGIYLLSINDGTNNYQLKLIKN